MSGHIKSLVLLMAEYEAKFFADRCHALDPAIALFHADSPASLKAAMQKASAPVNLFGFLTPVIVPVAILNRLETAYNLHPGPPSRPGHRPVTRALDAKDARHGVTLHEMVEEVDSGAILATSHFDVEEGADLEALEKQTYIQALQLALSHLDIIVGLRKPDAYSDEDWGQP